ncbi:chromate transporter [Oryzomicrobium sp.]|uniref:chromate transporter n=1 Tax=Oryzomicrobium sp. TaxID=1911578 RepID=UPI002FE3E6BC
MSGILVQLFLHFALLSFLSFGGANALLPEIHRVVVHQQHWMNDATFTHLYAVAQAAPGPNVLVVTLVGWQVAGVAGAVVSTVAMCLPMSVVIYFIFRHWERFRGAPWQQAVQVGVAPLSIGLVFSSGTLIGLTAGLGPGGIAATLATILVCLRFPKLHPLWLIAGGALLGLLGLV